MTHQRIDRFSYRGYHGSQAHCHIDIYRAEKGVEIHGLLVVMTEAEDNTGTSITNAAETIATSIARGFPRSHARITWMEHSLAQPRVQAEHDALVTFEWYEGIAVHGRFLPISGELAEGLIAAFNR